MEDGELIDGAVERSGFDADDEGNFESGGGGGGGDIGGAGGGEGLKVDGAVGFIDVGGDGSNGAIGIERGAEAIPIGQFEGLRLADEGLFLRTGEDGAGGRVVGERKLGGGLGGALEDFERILAGTKAANKAEERMAGRFRMESAGDILSIAFDGNAGQGRGIRDFYTDEDIASGDLIRTGGDGGDTEGGGGVRDDEGSDSEDGSEHGAGWIDVTVLAAGEVK